MPKLNPPSETETTALATAAAELDEFVGKLRRPASVQLAESNLKDARKLRARALDRATIAAAQYRVTGAGSMQTVQEAERVVADADEVVNAARQRLDEARQAWKPQLLAEISKHRSVAETLLAAELADVTAALALLDRLARLIASRGIDGGAFAGRARSRAVDVLYR